MIFGVRVKGFIFWAVLLVCSLLVYVGVGMKNKIPSDTKVNVFIKAINSD